MNKTEKPQKLTVKQVAEMMGISIPRVHQLIKEGRLFAEKIGRDWIVESDALTDKIMNRPNGRPPKNSAPAK